MPEGVQDLTRGLGEESWGLERGPGQKERRGRLADNLADRGLVTGVFVASAQPASLVAMGKL